jgi:hypothetical protein
VEDNFLESTWYLGAGFVSPAYRGRSIPREFFTFAVEEVTNFDTSSTNKRRFKSSRYRTRIQIIAKANDAGFINYYRTGGGLEVTQAMTLEEYSKSGWNFSISADQLGLEIVGMEKTIGREAAVLSNLWEYKIHNPLVDRLKFAFDGSPTCFSS